MSFSHWFISPRMPADVPLMFFCVGVAAVLMIVTPFFTMGCFLYIHSFGLVGLFASYALALVTSIAVHGAFFWRVWKLSKTGAAEIGLAVVFFSLAPSSGEVLEPWMSLLGLFAALRPLTDGPEPYGWGPVLQKLRRHKK